MEFRNAMESLAEAWIAAATAGNIPIFPGSSTPQSQPLSLTTNTTTVNPSLQNTNGNSNSNNNNNNSRPNNNTDSLHNSGKTITVRCVIESVANVESWDSSTEDSGSSSSPLRNNGQIEYDRSANLPIHIVFQDVMEAVLAFFGYPKETASFAKGIIQVENWKPIRLDKVAQNSEKTVYDVLGRISPFVTIRIRILRCVGNVPNNIYAQMKEKLLQLLILQNREHILNSGCPLDQVTLKNVLSGGLESAPPSEEMVRKFDQWVATQYRLALRPLTPYHPMTTFPFHTFHHHHHPREKNHPMSSPEEHVHPALQTVHSQYPTQKTRMRTSFDPELELPKLQKWFSENQHPSRQQIQAYVNELNSLESRRGRKPLDVNNVVYWFKNARAAQKRSELRTNVTTGILGSLNGYRSGSHSPCDTTATSKGSLGSCEEPDLGIDDDDCNDDDDDDDDEECGSKASEIPECLQLTKHNEEDDRDDIIINNNNNTKDPDKWDNKNDDVEVQNSTAMRDDRTERRDKDNKGSECVEEESEMKKITSKRERMKLTKSESEMEEDEDDDDYDDEEDEEDMEEEYSKGNNSGRSTNSEMETRIRSALRQSSPLQSLVPRAPAAFPLVHNSMLSQSFMYMSQYFPNLGLNARHQNHLLHQNSHQQIFTQHQQPLSGRTASSSGSSNGGGGKGANFSDDRRKRNRTFIDPVTEVPCLEQWFCMNTHPSHGLILQYTENLNSMPYRQKFPRLEPKNVQFWFKNRRAKCKRLKTSLYENVNTHQNDQYLRLSKESPFHGSCD